MASSTDGVDSSTQSSTSAGDTSAKEADGPAAIEVRGLRKEYGNGDDAVVAVDGVDFEVEAGTAVGILGPNGAGKTTTIKSLLTLVLPTEGDIRVDGIDVHENPQAAYERIGAMLEGARNVYWRLTVRENVRFFSALAGLNPDEMRDRYDQLLEQFGLADKADTTVRELSRGQQQKVALVCTMARNADVVFLDEPTLGLDVESSLELRKELRTLVEEEGTTILLSSHDMDVIQEVCDRVIIMNDGRIVADDTVANLLDVFSTQSYEITVDGAISRDARRQLRSNFEVTEIRQRNDRTMVNVRASQDDFYQLVDTFRENGLSVSSFDTVRPDLEEVFLRVTDETGDRRAGLEESGQ